LSTARGRGTRQVASSFRTGTSVEPDSLYPRAAAPAARPRARQRLGGVQRRLKLESARAGGRHARVQQSRVQGGVPAMRATGCPARTGPTPRSRGLPADVARRSSGVRPGWVRQPNASSRLHRCPQHRYPR
jgi:hypothetical protein